MSYPERWRFCPYKDGLPSLRPIKRHLSIHQHITMTSMKMTSSACTRSQDYPTCTNICVFFLWKVRIITKKNPLPGGCSAACVAGSSEWGRCCSIDHRRGHTHGWWSRLCGSVPTFNRTVLTEKVRTVLLFSTHKRWRIYWVIMVMELGESRHPFLDLRYIHR